MFYQKKYRIVFGVILIVLVASFLQGLFIDVTRDSGKYATVAKEIFLNSNWFNITVCGEPYLQKPPFMFWLSAISFHIFGISNFSFKLPLLLFSLAGVYFTYRVGKSLYNSRIGFLSAILLVFSEYFLLYTMDIHTDTILMPLVIFSIWQLCDYVKNKRILNLVGAAIGIGLAMLTKGPIGAVIPVFAIGVHLLVKKNFKQIFDWRWLLLIFIVILIISPELWSLYGQFGREGIFFYFWINNVGRLTGEYVGSNNDYFFFFHTLLYMLLPWSFFFYVASFNELRRVVRKGSRSHELFMIGGVWVFLIVMSISRSKLPNYIYALSPMMAITTAKWMYYALRIKGGKLRRLFLYLQTITEVLIWILIALISFYIFPLNNIVVVGVIVALFLSYLYIKLKKKPDFFFLNSIISMLALVFVLNFHLFPEIYSQQAVPLAARIYNKDAQKNEKLYNYHYSQYELFFYGRGLVGQIKDELELKQVMQKGKSWIFMDKEAYEEISTKPFEYPCDSIISFRHASLNKGIRYINPVSREASKEDVYLLYCK